MPKIESISFSEFYINEFFDQVREKTRTEYEEENYKLVDELFTLLSSQNEITDGISKLAEEQASSELSIFLFDIYDRAQDYPPSELVDALPEIAEDFVSGLSIMLEEENEILNSIDRVVKNLRGETDAGRDTIEVEPEQETDFEDDVSERKIPEETQSFQEFVEIRFFEQLQTALQIQLDEEKTNNNIAFIKLISEQLNKLPDSGEDESLVSVINQVSQALPWHKSRTFIPSDIMNRLPSLIDGIVTSLHNLDNTIIDTSIKEGNISVREAEDVEDKDEKFIKEEIPAEPTTIDSLLSDYFQTEANEHALQFNDIFKNLQKNIDTENNLQELLEAFQSFKEISMIHGYIILEDFCSEIIAIINQSKKRKKGI